MWDTIHPWIRRSPRARRGGGTTTSSKKKGSKKAGKKKKKAGKAEAAASVEQAADDKKDWKSGSMKDYYSKWDTYDEVGHRHVPGGAYCMCNTWRDCGGRARG